MSHEPHSDRDDPSPAGTLRHLRPLAFPAPLEREFREAHRQSVRRMTQLGLVVALFTTLSFAIVDHLALIRTNIAADLVRFALQLPLIVACLLATHARLYRQWYERAIIVGAILFGSGTVVMAATAAPENVALVGSRLLLVTFFVYFLVGLRMRQALLANGCIVLVLAGANLLQLFAPAVAAYQLFGLVCANFIGAAGAYALEHANRTAFLERKRLVIAAEQDGLTGLLNRHAFESRLRSFWSRSSTSGEHIAVIMIDIDHFKPYNDRLGHQAGDECLRRVAAAVQGAVGLGADRFVARYGGEELVAVIAGRDAGFASQMAQAVVTAVARLGIEHPGSDTAAYITVSVGAASDIPGSHASHDVVVKVADRALYTAKRQGRNRSIAARVPRPDDATDPGAGAAGTGRDGDDARRNAATGKATT